MCFLLQILLKKQNIKGLYKGMVPVWFSDEYYIEF